MRAFCQSVAAPTGCASKLRCFLSQVAAVHATEQAYVVMAFASGRQLLALEGIDGRIKRAHCFASSAGPACAQAPVAFELVAANRDGVRVRVRNKDTFVSTADLRLRWRLVLDGSPLALPRPKPGADGYYAVGDLDVPAQVGRAGRPLPV